MARYSLERREWVIRQMMPPLNRRLSELSEETGITLATLYAWRRHARESGVAVPGDGKHAGDWSSADKFRMVLEVASLSDAEVSEYCRRKGVFVEQLGQWRTACEQANASAAQSSQQARAEAKASAQRIRRLESELRRKEAALAEAAALLVLRKKVDAMWGEAEDV
jgi:transposase-like protein